MFALAGRAFTKSVADRLDLPFPRAEALKVDYARGLATELHDEVAEIIADDVAVWAAGVELMTPDQVTSIEDASHRLVEQQDGTPLALAHQASELRAEQDPLDAALH